MQITGNLWDFSPQFRRESSRFLPKKEGKEQPPAGLQRAPELPGLSLQSHSRSLCCQFEVTSGPSVPLGALRVPLVPGGAAGPWSWSCSPGSGRSPESSGCCGQRRRASPRSWQGEETTQQVCIHHTIPLFPKKAQIPEGFGEKVGIAAPGGSCVLYPMFHTPRLD